MDMVSSYQSVNNTCQEKLQLLNLVATMSMHACYRKFRRIVEVQVNNQGTLQVDGSFDKGKWSSN